MCAATIGGKYATVKTKISFFFILQKAHSSHIACVTCVCVCVGERGRQNERKIGVFVWACLCDI